MRAKSAEHDIEKYYLVLESSGYRQYGVTLGGAVSKEERKLLWPGEK